MTNHISLCPLKADSPQIAQATELYISAFPTCERREVKDWLECLDKDSQKPFTLFAIMNATEFFGFISCWEFKDFVYVEHFAVNANARGNGIGASTMTALKEIYSPKPLVLEVEVPDNEMAIRRIGFYQRQGFHINEQKYLQPPYRKEDEWFELKLMATNTEFVDHNFDHILNDIYKTVYNVDKF